MPKSEFSSRERKKQKLLNQSNHIYSQKHIRNTEKLLLQKQDNQEEKGHQTNNNNKKNNVSQKKKHKR